jgi:hypothetical protein
MFSSETLIFLFFFAEVVKTTRNYTTEQSFIWKAISCSRNAGNFIETETFITRSR